MDARDEHLGKLKIAEQQFRLACTVHLAVCNGVQTLDTPLEWAFGKHRVHHENFGLRPDQAEIAAHQIELTATFVMASTIRDALGALIPNPKSDERSEVVAAYQTTRMIRNAFSHGMLNPKWSIDEDCRDKVFKIDDIISFDTKGLSGKHLHWRDYGGPLAIFYLGRFVREKVLDDQVDPNRVKPAPPTLECYQQGRLILRRIDELPPGLTSVAPGEPSI